MVKDIGSFEARKTEDSGSHAPYTDALKAYVDAFPDQTLAERARHLQGSTFCIWYGLKRINCTRKKTLGNHKERFPKQRRAYCQELATAQGDGKSSDDCISLLREHFADSVCGLECLFNCFSASRHSNNFPIRWQISTNTESFRWFSYSL